MSLPTAVEPVKATLSMSGSRTSAAPAAPSPGRMETTPGGSSASWRISASSSAVSGVVSAGLSTAVLPHASAGASFQAAIRSGKFQGTICAATPCGADRGHPFRRRACRPSPRSRRSARRPGERRCRATRGSACRRPSTRRRPARARVPGSAARCGTGTCRAPGRRARPSPAAPGARSTARARSAAPGEGHLGQRLLGGRVDRGHARPSTGSRNSPSMNSP